MIFNIDMTRFMDVVKTIPSPAMLTNIYDYMLDNKCDHVPDSFTSFAMSTVEHVSSDGLLLYGGIIYVEGWDVGRPNKRRLPWKKRKALEDTTFKSIQKQAVSIFKGLLRNDPDRECMWSIIIRINEPTTQRNTNHLKTTCLFMVDRDGRVIMFDPLGSHSQVKIVSRFAFLAVECAYKMAAPLHPVTGIVDTSMFVMDTGDCQSSIWCIYIAFHVVNMTFHRLKNLSPEELRSDYIDFCGLLPQHLSAAIIVLHRHTTELLRETR